MPISLKKAEDILVYAPEQDCVVLVSPPGTGKSSIAIRAARRAGLTYLPVYAPTMEAVDARGLPYPLASSEGTMDTAWAAPSFLPLAKNHRDSTKRYLVNFDDWFQCPPPVLRATVRSIYGDGGERRIGDFLIYQNVRFMGTGNREQDRAGVYRPETYVNDRITYVEVEPDVDEWVSGAIGGFAQPQADDSYADVRAKINKAVALGIPDELVAYVKWSKQCYEFSTEQRSFLSPRSLERLGRFIRAFDAAGIDGDVLQEVASGTIGEAQAVKFLAFHKLRAELPDTDAILAGKEVPLPPKSEVLYILATTIARASKARHCAAVAKLINRLAETVTKDSKHVGVEVSAYLVHECLSGTGKELRGVRSEAAFIAWLKANGKYFAG